MPNQILTLESSKPVPLECKNMKLKNRPTKELEEIKKELERKILVEKPGKKSYEKDGTNSIYYHQIISELKKRSQR